MLVFKLNASRQLTTLDNKVVTLKAIVAFQEAHEPMGLQAPKVRICVDPELTATLRERDVDVASYVKGKLSDISGLWVDVPKSPKTPKATEAPTADELSRRFAGLV